VNDLIEHARTSGRGTRYAAALLMLLAAALILWAGHDLTFYADDWAFVQRRQGTDLDVFLRPHNEHLSAVPIAVYKALFATAGLDHHWPYVLAAVLAHVCCAVMVFAYARNRVGEVAALAAAALVAFMGQAWEIFYVTIGIGFVVSLIAGTGALLLLDRRTRRGYAGASLLVALGLASSSLGLPVALGVLVELLWHREDRRRAWVALAPAALYLVWLVAYRDGGRSLDLGAAPGFLADVAASAFGGLTGVALVSNHLDGALSFLDPVEHVLALAALILLVRTLVRRGPTPRLAMLMTTLAGFWLALAAFRSGGEPGAFRQTVEPYSTRYLYPSAVLLVLLGVELARGRAPAGRPLRALVAVVAVVAIANTVWLFAATDKLRGDATTMRAELGALEIMRDEIPAKSSPTRGPGSEDVETGDYLAAVDRTGSSPADSAGELAAAPEEAREAADRLLIRSQGIAWLKPRAGGLIRARCRSARQGAVGHALDLVLGPAGAALPRRFATPIAVRFRRFADHYRSSPEGTIAEPVTLRPLRGRAARPWHVLLTAPERFELCPIGSR
jgi:hypothetical protein